MWVIPRQDINTLSFLSGEKMPSYTLLNNISHKDLKVINRFSASYGDNIASTLTFPTEFADIQREYPILFRKAPDTGKFESVVLFGFQKNENLFLNSTEDGNAKGNGWNAGYIPAVIARGPFLIGFQTQNINGIEEKVPVIHVDMDSPRLSNTEGTPVFLEHGGNSAYLENVSRTLQAIHEGMIISDAMFAAFTRFDLIEPVTVDIELNNGNKYQLTNYHTISAEKLSALSGEALFELNNLGFLHGAFLVLSSLANLNKLIGIKNRRG
jgi:hypothetical protein